MNELIPLQAAPVSLSPLKMHLLASLSALLATIGTAHAKVYCSCEADSYRYRYSFKGIQQKCHYISNDWCSTNCNIAGYNCDYCQYKPAGEPDEHGWDYKDLKYWCSQQQIVRRGESIYGELWCWPYTRLSRVTTVGLPLSE